MAYVERNPVRARMVPEAGLYRWSSANAHLTGCDADSLLDLSAWKRHYDCQRWRRVLETSVGEEAFGQRIQEASLRGRPLGSNEFVAELESQTGRRLRPHPVGHPKRNAQDLDEQLSFENCV